MSQEALGRRSLVDRARHALEELLWGVGARGLLAEAFRVLAVTGWKFDSDRGFLRASALTYTTLLSLVPLLALMFAVLKGLGVQERLEPLLLEHLAAGSEEVVARVLEYVDRTNVGALGTVGLLTLVLTAVSVLSNVELSFNDIWQVRKGRSLVRKVSDYTSLLLVGPVLLLAILSATTSLQSSAVLERLSVLGGAVPILLKALPYLAVWLLFTGVYLVVPNRRVPAGPAMVAGFAAGAVWYAAELLYIRFQFGIGRYNAIYGALAQLPLLLVWVYLSWCIVLLGAELCFILQLPGRGRYLQSGRESSAPRFEVALALLLAVARRFELGLPAPQEQDLTAELGLHPSEGSWVVGRLVAAGLLTTTQEDPPGLVPARSPDRTSVAELLEAVTQLSRTETVSPALAARLRSSLGTALGEVTWAELSLEEGR